MIVCRLSPLALFALAGLFGFAGCRAARPVVAKERGVYTTRAMGGQDLDMPASGYRSCKTFGPGQTPAAVVAGYGLWNGNENFPQSFTMQLIEARTRRLLFARDSVLTEGKLAVMPLAIHQAGDYKLKLLINGFVQDTWDFTVKGNSAAGGSTNTVNDSEESYFTEYNDTRNHALVFSTPDEVTKLPPPNALPAHPNEHPFVK